MMKRTTLRRIGFLAVLCLLTVIFAVPAFAATYSKIYGKTQDKIRVRASASAGATQIDQIAKDAAVYILTSKTSGSSTFVQVRYRGYEGDILTGWICQTDGDDTYVKILSTTQAKTTFKVEGGNLPSKKVGLWKKAQRDAAKNGSGSSSSASSSSSSSSSASSATIKDVQTKLKALGYYSGDITGKAGDKTTAAIRAFQKKYGLVVDGVAGTDTVKKINSVYSGSSASSSSASSSSASSSSSSSSATIRDVQTKLKALGFYTGEVTGKAGEKTVAAIKAFQKKYSLTVDGVAGAATVKKLNSVYSSRSSSSSSGSSSGTTLKRGSSGAAVKTLQENLKALGYYDGDITGHYGSMTEASVAKFQKKKGLSETGNADPATQKAINSATTGTSSSGYSNVGEASVALYGKINKSNVYMRQGHSTTSASKVCMDDGTYVKITKKYTNGDTVWYYCSGKKDGNRYAGWVYGSLVTLISYSDYAKATGSDEDSTLGMIQVTSDDIKIREGAGTSYGVAGRANEGDCFYYTEHLDGWYKLKSGYYIMDKYCKIVSSGTQSSFTSGSSGSYKVGDTGSKVTWIQQSLKTLGYYDADVTGHYGEKTADAVEKFQSKHGITADGICGSKTIAAIEKALSSSSSSDDEDDDDDDDSTSIGSVSGDGKIYNISWFTAKSNGTLAKIGLVAKAHAKIKDLRTGKTLNIYIQSTGNHLDVEPLTATDTKTLCSIYGVASASYINYMRRPLLLTTSTGVQVVCSMYGTPHGQQKITDNNFPGQFCIHFKNSKTHNSDKVDSDHQAAIDEAISLVGSGRVKTVSSL